MMKHCLTCRLISGLLLLLIGVLPAHSRTRQVVLLYDERTTLPGLAAMDASIAHTLTSSSAEPIEVYRESMDLSRFGSDNYFLLLQDYLRKKYADKKIDVVVAAMSPALDFLLSHEKFVFPGTPIVFCGIDRRELGGRALPSRVTGVILKRAFAPTLDIALKLHPRTKRVVFVAGTSEFDSRLLGQAREELLLYKNRLDFTYLTAVPMRDLLSHVSELPPHTIVLYSTLFKDGEGAPFVPHDVAERLASASNAPVYGFNDQYLGRGIVGGRMYTLNAHGEAAAGLVLKILAGIPPSSIPVVEPEASVMQFDSRQLQRWGIRESQLPQGSTVLFRQLSFWDKYKLYVFGVGAILTLQAVIIGGLLLQRKRRRRAEEALRASEERLRLAQQAARIGTFDWNIRTGVNTWTPELEAMYGLPPGGFGGAQTAFENLVHPDDRAGVIKLVDAAMKSGQPTKGEWRVVWVDGSVHWIAGCWQVFMDASGEPSKMIGVNMNVTERKRSEETLREYEKAVEGAEDMIGVIDREYRYLLANRQYLKMRNLTREQVVGHFVPEVLNREIFETVIKPKLDECFQGKVVRYEMKFSYPTVGERDLLLSYFPIEGVNGVDRAACILHDITDRKRSEEALFEMNRTLEAQGLLLQSREDLLKIFVKNVPAAVAMLDRDMRYLQVSDRWCVDFSLESSQVLGRSHYEIFPDLPERWKEIHRRALAGETLRAEEDPWDREGGTIWSRWEIRPWLNVNGTPGGILIFSEDITHRKQMEEALRESEDKLRLLLDSTAEAIYGIDLEHRCTFCNPACLRTLGYERMDEVLGENTHDLMHRTRADGTPFPIEECRVHRVARTGEGVHAEDEVFWRANGTCFPVEYWSYPQRREEKVVGAVVAFIDITERKLAETALANVSRRLIEAQEQERSRIGRELHDDIGQRLALLTVELQQLHEDRLILPKVRSRMGELQKQTVEIATDIQSLSHELHSARLQYLGIAGAIRGFCREFGEQQKVEIDFTTHDLPSPLSPDTSLCFFRVLQEALHNSAKHSGVRHFQVQLWGTSDEIHLTVNDSGAGFDREAAKTSRGLGLISMEERLKLVKGTLTIDSQPKRGTTIHARVPLDAEHVSQRAAG